jgi:RNA polymerase subunit RPABC4/transcription elongation factor Spt4
MKLPPSLNVYVSAALFVIGAYVVALYLGLIVWTFRDIRSRTRDMLAHIMAALLVAVFNLPGLLIYMLVRPKTTLAEEYDRTLTEEAVLHELDAKLLCPNCQHDIETDFIVCPSCHHQLKLRCVGCGRLVLPDWDVCPYCGRFQDDTPAAVEPETAEPDEAEVLAFTPPAPVEDEDPTAEDDWAAPAQADEEPEA